MSRFLAVSGVCSSLLLFFLLVPATYAQQGQDSAGEQESSRSGRAYVQVKMQRFVDSLYVITDGQYDASVYVANGSTVAIDTSVSTFAVSTRRTRDFVIPFSDVVPDSTYRLDLSRAQIEQDRETYLANSSYPVLRTGNNLTVVTDADAQVVIDGEARGRGAMRLRLAAGEHRVKVSHPVDGEIERVVEISDTPPRMVWVTMYTKPKRRRTQYLSFVPGGAQIYKQDRIKGLALAGGFLLTSVGAIQQSLTFSDLNEKYETAQFEYRRTADESEALRLGRLTDERYDAARGAYWRRNMLIGLTTGVYLYSVLDGWLNRPEGGYRTTRTVPLVTPLIGAHGQSGVRFALTF